MKTTFQRQYYRNGQPCEEVPLRGGRRHGLARTWHKNGTLASEDPYQNGLLHGVCRRWDEQGRLLGKYSMVQGTGKQREWHDNRQLRAELSTVRGELCGRGRLWLRDGTLLADKVYLFDRTVTPEEYRAAAATHRELPRLRGRPAKALGDNRAAERHKLRVFVAGLLEKRNCCEAERWLQPPVNGIPGRSLGRFKRPEDAGRLVKDLYRAGAAEVIVPDIYHGKAGVEFADCLLVRLPRNPARRKAVRAVCAKLKRRRLGSFLPDQDIGETHLYLSMA